MSFSVHFLIVLLYFHISNVIFTSAIYYIADDEVISLDADILDTMFYEVPNVWLLHLYQSNCRNCPIFAEVWKKLAIDFIRANNLIKFGALNCASIDVKANVCKTIKKTNETLLVQYFPENFLESADDGGQSLQIDFNVVKLKKTIINHIIYEINQGRGKLFPKLAAYTSPNATNLFKETTKETKYVILLIDTEKSLLGVEMALDLHLMLNISFRYSYKNNTALINEFEVTEFPTMLIISVNGTVENVIVNVNDKKKLENIIEEFLKPIPKSTTVYKNQLTTKSKEHVRLKLKRDYTFLMDLETALRYSFKQEIGIMGNINDQEYDALVAYINVILKYFPFSRKGRKFMTELKQIIQNPILVITGKKILHIFRSVENHYSDIFTFDEEWFACDHNTTEYQKYLCGFWKLFHYFTARAAEMDRGDCLEVLKAMQNYVRYFLKNREYIENALEIVDGEFKENVDDFDGAILWLWSEHNILNDRLSEEINEDPSCPKIQFPSIEDCPMCRSHGNTTWKMDEVLKYIKRINNFTAEITCPRMACMDVIHLLDYILHLLLYLTSCCLILALGHTLYKKCSKKLKKLIR